MSPDALVRGRRWRVDARQRRSDDRGLRAPDVPRSSSTMRPRTPGEPEPLRVVSGGIGKAITFLGALRHENARPRGKV